MTSSAPLPWLVELAKNVTAVMVPVDLLAPVGCHYHEADGVWEVTVFASMTEVVGGEEDGRRFPSQFVLDIGGLLAVFDDVDSVKWQVLPHDSEDEIGAHVAVEGWYASKRILLRIPAMAPECFDVGRFANFYEMRYVNAW